MDHDTQLKQAVRSRSTGFSTMLSAVFVAASLMAVAPAPARAQAFADVKSALVDYSKADIQPRKTCEDLGKFKSKEIVQIAAAAMPAANGAPAHCRVTGSDLARDRVRSEPSIEMEWTLLYDRQRRPRGRGVGRRRPGRAAQSSLAARLRLRADQHRPRRSQGTRRNLRDEQSAEGDRLRLARSAPHGHHGQGHHQGLLRQVDLARPIGTRVPTADARVSSKRSASRTISTASWRTRPGRIRPASPSARCGIRRR